MLALLHSTNSLSYPTYSCRYRMTVNVEVYGQLRSGSSVIEFWASKRPRVPGSILMKTGVVGEAVFVDLGRQTSASISSSRKVGPAITPTLGVRIERQEPQAT